MYRLGVVLLAGAAAPAAAFPDGAPWGAADPGAAENCATCHFGSDPVTDSDAITLEGWPRSLEAGVVYPLVLRFSAPAAAVAGAQLLVRSDGAEAGVFVRAADGMETSDGKARTTAPRPFENGEVSWRLEWRSPDAGRDTVSLCVGASAANDDASAFGDTIHFRCFEAASLASSRPEKQSIMTPEG